MKLEAILHDAASERAAALAACAAAPEHERSAFAAKVAAAAREAAAALTAADEAGEGTFAHETSFGRACLALSILRVEGAKSALLRLADEGSHVVKTTLAQALRESRTAEGRAALVHLLSDDDACPDAILAIGAAPWPEVLPALIEVAEADDHAARLAAAPIAKCGAAAGPKETNAAADYLVEQLDDDVTLVAAMDALIRFGAGFPGVAVRARRLAREPGKRKIAGLCLVAAFGDEGNADFLELALSGSKATEAAARTVLGPLLRDADERIRGAAERTWQVLDLGPLGPPSR
ncbi:MAG: hypothetical protein KF764_18805 [Labilithrix sp.]|nr:hypothetical protein [Labilithrix sp.]